MRVLFVAFIMLGGITAFADDLADLKAAAKRYVAGGSWLLEFWTMRAASK